MIDDILKGVRKALSDLAARQKARDERRAAEKEAADEAWVAIRKGIRELLPPSERGGATS